MSSMFGGQRMEHGPIGGSSRETECCMWDWDGGDLGSHSTLGSLPLLHQNPLESFQNTTDAWA